MLQKKWAVVLPSGASDSMQKGTVACQNGWGGKRGGLETPSPTQMTTAWGSLSMWTFYFPLEGTLGIPWCPPECSFGTEYHD